MKSTFSVTARRQQGAALIISLVIILIMTMLGVTGMQVTGLEEKMAGNARDVNLAFQAAEVGMRAGEAYVDSLVTQSGFNGNTTGLLSETTDDPDYLDSSVWSSGIAYTGGLEGVAAQPEYIIKLVGEEEPDANASLNIGGYGEDVAGGNVTVFRVTARGTGGTEQAVVLLQSHFGKRF